MLTVGLDVHKGRSSVCILDEHGVPVKEKTILGPVHKVRDELAGLGEPFQVCYEASCGYGAIHDLLRPLARRVVVAHPGHLRLIFHTKRKCDRVDAQKLALLLHLDAVPAAHVPPPDVRSWRKLIEFRRRLVDRRTMTKNGVRALLRSRLIQAPPRGKLWTAGGLAWLEALELPEPEAVQRDLLLRHRDAQIRRVERQLDRIARGHPGVRLLRTIPGVGPRTAEVVVAYIDDPRRFGRKQVGAYFGLVPRLDQSADKARFGHITRQGPPTARKMLIEAAWQGIRRDAGLRAFFEQICRGDKDRRKIALVATAHHLLRIMHKMLLTGEAWCPEDAAEPAKGKAMT